MTTADSKRLYFQDMLHGNHCFGCGAWNERGLRIKSFWDVEETAKAGQFARDITEGKIESVCIFEPQPHHAAMPPDVMNGGIIASVIDCHSVCTAIAEAYAREGRSVGEGAKIWYATASLQVNYRRPTPVDDPVTVRARITGIRGRKTELEARLFSHEGELTCDGLVVAARVPDEWADPEGLLPHLRGTA